LPDLLDWLPRSALAQALTASPTLYLLVNAAHILSIALLVGAIVPLDLRLLGFFRRVPLCVVGSFLSGSAMIGAGLAIASGIMLFSVQASKYAANPAFLTKMGLLAVGITNAMIFQTMAPWRRQSTVEDLPACVRIIAGVSLVTWVAAVIAGRWIGFV
jgi:hypothetical protein